MNKLSKIHYLRSIGMLTFSITFIVSHYNEMPDFLKGSLMGIGIGLTIISLILQKKVKTNS